MKKIVAIVGVLYLTAPAIPLERTHDEISWSVVDALIDLDAAVAVHDQNADYISRSWNNILEANRKLSLSRPKIGDALENLANAITRFDVGVTVADDNVKKWNDIIKANRELRNVISGAQAR